MLLQTHQAIVRPRSFFFVLLLPLRCGLVVCCDYTGASPDPVPDPDSVAALAPASAPCL